MTIHNPTGVFMAIHNPTQVYTAIHNPTQVYMAIQIMLAHEAHGVMEHGPRCARSAHHDLGPNIFPPGPPIQSKSTYYFIESFHGNSWAPQIDLLLIEWLHAQLAEHCIGFRIPLKQVSPRDNCEDQCVHLFNGNLGNSKSSPERKCWDYRSKTFFFN